MPGHLSATEAPEDLWTCHECGWTYPNHHPSAKHRRNHKKVCGSIPGFIGTISSRKSPPEPEPSMDGASSDDASSDDETTPDTTHEKCGHHHSTAKVAPVQQTVAAVQHAGTRAAKSLCVTHRSKEPCLHSEEAMKPAPLTERTLSDQNNRQALQSTGSNLSPAVKTQHVRRRSAHALEGVWVCRHCGWTYPNAHPSAKHRRKHKKKCPALVVTRHAVAAGGSSDDASSDEENRIQRAAALEQAEAPETNNLPMPANLSLEAFLSRSGSMNGGSPHHASLRELQSPIILLSPRPVSRRDSFLSPRHRREGPSLLLSPRGSMKNPKAVNNNQAQEVVTVTEKTSESLSDLENEDPVVLNLPPVRTVTNPQTVPAAENVGGETTTLQDERRSLSDDSDLNNSDGEAPRSPVSVLQTRHLLVPTATSTTTEETKTSDQEETDEEVTEQILHQEAAADAEAQKNESTDEIAVKQDIPEAAAPEPPLTTCEVLPQVDSLVSQPAGATAEQKESQEVSSVNIIQPVDASPCTELQTAVTGAICVAKETQAAFEADDKVTVSEELGTSLASVDNDHVEKSASDTDIAEEHVSTTALAVGGSPDAAASDDSEHHTVKDTNKGLILSDTDSVDKVTTEKVIEGQICKELDSTKIQMTDSTITLDNDFSSQAARREMPNAEVNMHGITSEQREGVKVRDLEPDCAKPPEIIDLKEESDSTGSDVALATQEASDLRSSELPATVPVLASVDLDTEDEGQISADLPAEVCADQTAVVEEEDRDLPTSSSKVLPDQPPPVDTTVEDVKEDRDLPTLSSEELSANQPPVDYTVEVVGEKDGDHPTVSSEASSADQPPVGTTVEVVSVEYRDLPSLSSKDLPADQAPVHVTVEAVKEEEDRNLPTSSSEVQSADQLPVAEKENDLLTSSPEVLVTSESQKESTHSTTSLSEVQETTNIVLDSLNAAQVQPTSFDTLEFGSQSTSIETLVPTTQSTESIVPAPDAIPEDDSPSDLSSEFLSATEKLQEPLDVKPSTVIVTPSTAIGISDLNSETRTTSKSQVVVTGPVGDCQILDKDQEATKPDQIESQVTDVEEKTASSVAIDSHLFAGKQELPEASHHSGAAEDLWTCQRNPKKNRRTVHGSDATGGSGDDVCDDAHSHPEVGIASKGAKDAIADQRISSSSEASSAPISTSSITEAVDELKSDPSTITNKEEEQQVSQALLAEACEVKNIKDQGEKPGVRELNEAAATTEQRTEAVVAEHSSIESNIELVEEGEKVEDKEKEVLVVAETDESQVKESGDMAASSSGSSDSCGISVPGETGAGGSGTKQAVIQVPTGKQAPTVTIPEASEKPVGLFGHWRARESKRELQREPSLKAREPTLPRLPGSGKRKALPALSFGTENSFPVTKKQESRPGMKTKTRDLKSDSMKLRARARSCGPESPPSTSPEKGGPGSPEGIVKVRIETYERMIGKMRTFGPASSPSYKSPTLGKFSSPYVSGLTIVTSHQQHLEHEEAAPSAQEQIAAVAAHLHHVEPKATTKVHETHDDAPEELLHEALSHLRHCELQQQQQQNNNSGQDSSEPEDSSQRISKVALVVLKEAAEHCLSPVPRLTRAY